MIVDGLELSIEKHDSIRCINAGLWDSHIGKLHPSKSHKFLAIIETVFPTRSYHYYTIYKQDGESARLIALFFSCQYGHDLLIGASGIWSACIDYVRRVAPGIGRLNVMMMGNPETHSQTWWFDEQVITEETFYKLCSFCINRHHRSAWLRLFRDFNQDAEALKQSGKASLSPLGYEFVQSLPLAIVNIDGLTPQDHLARLKQNSRKIIKKSLSKFESGNYKVVREEFFEHRIDALYPLYLNVHGRAKEFVREPFTKEFFEQISKMEGSELTLILDDNNGVCAFTVSIYNKLVYNAYLFGCKEISDSDPNFYTCLMWFDLENACSLGASLIDMGVTNYFPKQNFGAVIRPLTMAVSLRKPLSLLNRMAASALSEEQPTSRSVYRSV